MGRLSNNHNSDKIMKNVIKLILVLVMSVSCKAQGQKDMSVSELLENLRSEKNYHEQLQKEFVLKFYKRGQACN